MKNKRGNFLKKSDLARYERQLLLPGWGIDGQKKLADARVLVVGAGGLGCPALTYLAAAGIGRLGIIDPDTVSVSNLHRQPLYGHEALGCKKVQVARTKLLDLNPECRIDIYEVAFQVKNAYSIANEYDLIIDATDTFPVRYLINDVAVVLGKPFISAAIFQYDGQLSVFNARRSDGSLGPTYRCLYPKMPGKGAVPNCAEAGVIPTLPGILGTLQAQEAIKIITGIGEPLIGRLLIVDALSGAWTSRDCLRNDAVVAGTRVLEESEYMLNACESETVREISASDLRRMLETTEVTLVDVREKWERQIVNLGGIHIPHDEIFRRATEIRKDYPIIVYCKSGGRSLKAAKTLIEQLGFMNVASLQGGIVGWHNDVDPSVAVY